MGKILKMPPIFSDSMVLQRDCNIHLWGECTDGEYVEAVIDEIKVKTEVKNGKFDLYLPPHAAAKGLTMKVQSAENELVFSNVAFGEVWFALGQSNMNVGLERATNGMLGKQFMNADIRFFIAPRKKEDTSKVFYDTEQKKKVSLKWEELSGEYTPYFSAVGTVFASYIGNVLKVPVGIIDCNRGATSILQWIPQHLIKEEPVLVPYLVETIEDFNKPELKRMGIGSLKPAGTEYELMLKEVLPFSACGVLWYQGEADAGGKRASEVYKKAFQVFAKMLRDKVNSPELPIITVQLARFGGNWIGGSNGRKWAYMRCAQQKIAESMNNVYMVTGIDRGDSDDIHPNDKHSIGVRLAACALSEVYGYEIKWKAPFISKAQYEDGRIVLTAENTYGRLRLTDKSAKSGFEVKSHDGKWHNAPFEVCGESIIITEKDCSKVRYNFINNPKHCIYNYYGLPLLPLSEMRILK